MTTPFYDEDEPRSLERYSSAITLSDMEIFIFPELLYALVCANIMSPRLWKWKSDPWFREIGRQKPARRIHRLKQFIMDRFSFNLDLDTWGLTTKERELKRFSPFIDTDVLARSNALFGYEGDKYYFDIDIRRHFGLDRYTSEVIPYWKTETVEAMEAFRHKTGYGRGAGECVSLATLYAAAAFVVIGVPLEDIFLLATPLHSQNFLDINNGILTNNRRIVTKPMWFNGTEISAKARRALENEAVTIVSHASGYMHTVYGESTIRPETYNRLVQRLCSFLSVDRIDFEILANFLRHRSQLQRCFQVRHAWFGKPRYIEAEKVFAYEHSSKARVSDSSREALLAEIEEDEYYPSPLPHRLVFDEVESFFSTTRVSLDDPDTLEELRRYLGHACANVDQVMPDLRRFCRTEPRLPESGGKQFASIPPIDLSGVSSAEEAVERLSAQREGNATIDLAFSAYRDLERSPWKPFLKAALERNPVSVEGMRGLDVSEAYDRLASFDEESIYEEPSRLAQPDEVWNYRRGDGLEKAIALANVIRSRKPEAEFSVERDSATVSLIERNGSSWTFLSSKTVPLPKQKDFT